MEAEEMWILFAGVISVAVLLFLLLNLLQKTAFQDFFRLTPCISGNQITKNSSRANLNTTINSNLQRRLVLEILMSAGCPKSLHLKLEESGEGDNPTANLAALTNLASSLSSAAPKWNASALLRDLLKQYDRRDRAEGKGEGDPGALVPLKGSGREDLGGGHVTEGEGPLGFKAVLDVSDDENCGGVEVEVKISEEDVTAAGAAVAAAEGVTRGREGAAEWAVEAEVEGGRRGDVDGGCRGEKIGGKKKKNRKKKGAAGGGAASSAQKKMEELGEFIMAKAKESGNAEGELGCTCGTGKGDYHHGSCPYPFTSSASVIQRRIKQQYDELVHSNAARSLTLAQVGRFTNCLVEAKAALQQKSETIQRKFTIAKSLLAKADKSSFDRLCGQIYRLETEQKRLEEDTVVYNRLQEQLKLSPAYQKMLEYGRTHIQSQHNTDQLDKSDAEEDEISFEELLAQEKKDSFWQKHGRFRPSVPVS